MIIIMLVIFAIISIIYIYNNNENFETDYICSKKCCFSGWPNSVEINDNIVDINDIGTKYKTSNLNCNNGINDTGCICQNIII